MCQSFKASSKSAESKNFTFPGRCKRSPVSFPRSRRDVRCFCLTQPRVATLWAQKIRGGNLADWLSENKNDVFLNVTWNPWPISWYIQLSMIIQPKKKYIFQTLPMPGLPSQTWRPVYRFSHPWVRWINGLLYGKNDRKHPCVVGKSTISCRPPPKSP